MTADADLDLDRDTADALSAVFAAAPNHPKRERARRKTGERKLRVNPSDGRTRRATGRSAQLNVNIRPEVKEQLLGTVERLRRGGAEISVTLWLEQVALEFIAKSAREARNA